MGEVINYHACLQQKINNLPERLRINATAFAMGLRAGNESSITEPLEATILRVSKLPLVQPDQSASDMLNNLASYIESCIFFSQDAQIFHFADVCKLSSRTNHGKR